MFKQYDPVAERGLDPLDLALEEPGPSGVVVGDVDMSNQRR